MKQIVIFVLINYQFYSEAFCWLINTEDNEEDNNFVIREVVPPKK